MNTDDWITGQIQLQVDDTIFEMQLTVQAHPVKPERMLPVFQQVTNLYVEIGIAASKSEGKNISCRKGCNACCYHMIGLPEFEAFHIAQVIEDMPEPQQSEVKERINNALTHFTETGWIKRFENCTDYANKESLEVFVDYFNEGVACPFLVDEACSIYDDRPLMCREYLVTSPAENCSHPTKDNIELVKIPVRPSGNLVGLGQKKPLSRLNVIPLIMLLKWLETNQNNFPEKTGEEWMTEFFQSITRGEIPKQS